MNKPSIGIHRWRCHMGHRSLPVEMRNDLLPRPDHEDSLPAHSLLRIQRYNDCHRRGFASDCDPQLLIGKRLLLGDL